MKTFLPKIAWVTALILLFQSCDFLNKKEEVKPASSEYNIEMGAFTQLNSTTISSNGGTVSVNTGDLSGLKITVPKSAYTSSRQFIISTAELVNKEIGKNLNPISPVIKIENGGGYANGIIYVKIPIKLPSGHFPMGFFIDQENNKLEPIPIIDYDANSITLATRHFSSSTINQASILKGSRPAAGESYSNMIISSIAESDLNRQAIISSGFTPGVDDWEFVNFGSYLSPPGHCAGQSMTAMWYFYEKKLKDGAQLFHQFDKFNTKTDPTNLWQDNPLGYKISSVIQEDFNWGSWSNDMDFRSKYPSIVWKAFAVGMLVTGEPQSVLIRNSAGQGGHAMIVHKINFTEGKLYIADPNYPNNVDPWTKTNTIRTIDFVNDNFKPYSTGLSANTVGTISMDQISYFGKTAYIDWKQIGKRWKELQNKTIGKIAPNTFPSYKLWVNDGSGYEIGDSLTTNLDTLRLFAVSTEAEVANDFKGKKVIGNLLYDDKGKALATVGTGYNRAAILKPGVNIIGVYVYGWRKSAVQDNKYIDLYIDFKWIKVNYEKQASFEFKLRGIVKGELSYTFGLIFDPKEPYNTPLFSNGGSWSGNTFKADKKVNFPEGTVHVKITAVANANKTILDTFNVEMDLLGSSDKLVSIDGKNLPLERSDTEYLYFNVKGVSTCQYLTRVSTYVIIEGVKYDKWGCDKDSFVRFKIPKP